MGKTRHLFKKIRDTKGTFHAKMGSIKDINGSDLTEAEDIKKRWQEYTECLMNYGLRFMTLYRRQGSRPSPRKRNAKKQNGMEKNSSLDIRRNEIASEKAFASCFHLCWLAMSSCISGK